MIRSIRYGALVALLALTPVSASALGLVIDNVSSTGASTSVLFPGDQLTVDLRLENATQVELFGLGLGAVGFDRNDNRNPTDDRLHFVGGASAGSALNTARLPGTPNQAFGGLQNTLSAPVEIVEIPRSVSFFQGLSLDPVTGTGTDDVGIDGGYTGDGDVHFRLVFEATNNVGPEAGVVNLLFGTTGANGAIGSGGVVLPFNNASLSVTVIPEPGTALLMGLGLAGLAARRR